GQRDPDGLRLAAGGAELRVVPESTDQAGGLQTGPTELAGAAGDGERRDHQVAGADRGHLTTGLLDDADELVPYRRSAGRGRHRVVRVQVAPAHAGPDHAHERVGGPFDPRVGYVDHPDI